MKTHLCMDFHFYHQNLNLAIQALTKKTITFLYAKFLQLMQVKNLDVAK